MRIAVDVNVSNLVIGQLARSGYVICCVARKREDDRDWLERALEEDADVIISQDLDIPNLLDLWRVSDDVRWFESVDKFLEWRTKHG